MRTEEMSADQIAERRVTGISQNIVAPPRVDFGSLVLRSPATAVGAALLIRLIFLYASRDAGGQFYSVGQEAGNVAWALALGHGFSSPLAGMQGPTAWVAPLYPLLLAFGFKLFNMNPYHVVIFGQVLNAVFSAVTCWPIYLIAKKLFGLPVGVASSWAWAVLPTAILFPLEWIWDQSLSALLLTALICATLYLREDARAAPRNRIIWATYGLGWALALLTNPAIGLLLPFCAAWIVWQRHKRGVPWALRLAAMRPALASVGIALVACILGIVPWTARNYAAFGHFVPIKSNFGLEFWLGNNPDVKIIWTWWRSPASDPAEMSALNGMGEIAYMREKQREALSFIRANPGIFVDSSFDRFVDTWTALWDQHTDPWITAMSAGTLYVAFCSMFSLLALVGLLIARRADAFGILPLSAALLLFPLTYYITHSSVRYRHPIDPVMTILVVYAVTCAHAKLRKNVVTTSEARNSASPLNRDSSRR